MRDLLGVHQRHGGRRAAAVLTALALTLAACGSDDDAADEPAAESGDAEEPADATTDESDANGSSSEADESGADDELSGELRFAVRDYFQNEAESVVELYEQLRPNVDVELLLYPTDETAYRQQLVTGQLADDLPDVLATFGNFVQPAADAGITQDLGPILEGSSLDPSTFAPGFLAPYETNGEHAGEIHGLPQSADAVVLYYNKDLFDAAGVAYPDDTWTYDDFLDAARQLTITDGDRTETYGFSTWYEWRAIYQPMMVAQGGDMIDADGNPTLDSAEALEAWHMILDPVQEGIFMPPEVQSTLGGWVQGFTSGTAAMFAGVRSHTPIVRNSLDAEWDVAQMPTINGNRAVGSGSVGISVSASADTELARDFLEFYFAEDGGLGLLAETYAIVPAIESQWDSEYWRGLAPPPANADAFVQAIQAGIPSPSIPFLANGGINEAITTAYERVLIGGDNIEDAFADANEQAVEAFAEAEG